MVFNDLLPGDNHPLTMTAEQRRMVEGLHRQMVQLFAGRPVPAAVGVAALLRTLGFVIAQCPTLAQRETLTGACANLLPMYVNLFKKE